MTKSLYCNKIEVEKGKCRNRQKGFVMMPDHFHSIVKIVHPESDNFIVGAGDFVVGAGDFIVGTGDFIVGTGRDLSLRCNNPDQKKYKPLTQIIGAFKTTSSKMIHMTGYNSFTWQRSYYDHIIRDVDSLIRIRKYIINNPANWECNKIK